MAELGCLASAVGKDEPVCQFPCPWGTTQQIISRANAEAAEAHLTRQHQEKKKGSSE